MMNKSETTINESLYKKVIISLSIIIPLAVAALFKVKIDGYNLSFLPPIYASFNAITAILLVLAVVKIKNGQRDAHEKLMKSALIFSSLFLVLYVLYHITSESTKFGGTGIIAYVYYFILISHIILSIIVIPFVLFTYLRAIIGNFAMHKKIAKITFPIWLYVAVSGVIVYILISPYY